MRRAVALVLVAFAASCNDSNDDGTNFNQFVLNQINQTSETSEPVSLDGVQFSFNENPAAFDSLFP